MPFTAEIGSINQTAQFGVESTPGVAVPANKRIDNLLCKFGAKGDFKKTSGTGRKYPSVQQLNAEWVEGSLDGSMDYNSMLYPLTGALGVTTPVAHGTSVVAKDWIIDASLSGAKQPQTLSIEQGDSVRAHKFAYGLVKKFGYKLNRKTDASISGDILAQSITDGITMTASPTPVVLSPMTGQHFNIYLDATFAALGTSQVLKALSADFTMDSIYGPAWYINRSLSSFSAHVDLNPNASVKFKVAADAAGMASLGDMRAGITKFMRIEAQGPIIDNTQTVTLGPASAGNFTLTYKGQTTGNIAFNATNTTVQTAFTGLSTVGVGNATVAGGVGGPYIITFTTSGTLATDTTPITGNGAGLTGGAFVITQTQTYARFWHDMSIKIGQPSEWGDTDGVYAIEWSCDIFEDGGWGHAHMFTLTNLITAL